MEFAKIVRVVFSKRIFKALFCLLYFGGIGANVYSQDLIVKKDGEEIKSKVMEVSGDEIKYKMWDYQDGPVYRISASEIFMIKYQNGKKDIMSTYVSASRKSVGDSRKYPHYQGEINTGYALGLDNAADRIIFETIHGVRISKYAFVGVGLGFNTYKDILVDISLDRRGNIKSIETGWGMAVPVFLDIKGYCPVTKDFAPYIDLGLGCSIGVMEIEGSGFLANVGFGINYKKLNIGMNFQSENKAKGFVFKLGVKF